MSRYVLLDIGGTSIKTALFDKEMGEVKEYPTDAKKGADKLIEKVIEIAMTVLKLLVFRLLVRLILKMVLLSMPTKICQAIQVLNGEKYLVLNLMYRYMSKTM